MLTAQIATLPANFQIAKHSIKGGINWYVISVEDIHCEMLNPQEICDWIRRHFGDSIYAVNPLWASTDEIFCPGLEVKIKASSFPSVALTKPPFIYTQGMRSLALVKPSITYLPGALQYLATFEEVIEIHPEVQKLRDLRFHFGTAKEFNTHRFYFGYGGWRRNVLEQSR